MESDPKCPNCRADITATGPHPNFVVREIINGLQVRCPDGGTECNWTGRVDALDTHGNTCIYKTIECDVEGCNHTCQRQHMGDHLSDPDVKFRHMELKYDKKLKDMETKYEAKLSNVKDDLAALLAGRIAFRRRRVRDEGEGAQRNVRARQEEEEAESGWVVEGCGINAINGVYSRDGESDNVPKYVRRAQYNGREAEFSLFRTQLLDGRR